MLEKAWREYTLARPGLPSEDLTASMGLDSESIGRMDKYLINRTVRSSAEGGCKQGSATI